MLYKIRCNPTLPLYGALPEWYLPVSVTSGVVIAHRYIYAHPHCGTSQYSRNFITLSVALWNNFSDPVFDGVGTGGLREEGQFLFIGLAARSLFIAYLFPFSSFILLVGMVMLGSSD